MDGKRSIVPIVFGCLYLIQGTIMVIQRAIAFMRKPHLLYTTSILIGLLLFYAGIGLLRLKGWSRKVVIYLNIFWIIYTYSLLIVFKTKFYNDVIGLLLFVLVNIYFIVPIYYLTRPQVKEQFK